MRAGCLAEGKSSGDLVVLGCEAEGVELVVCAFGDALGADLLVNLKQGWSGRVAGYGDVNGFIFSKGICVDLQTQFGW